MGYSARVVFLVCLRHSTIIPNKLGGVVALAGSVAILYRLGFCSRYKMKGIAFYPINKPLFWSFCSLVILLTLIGARPVEDPYIFVGQVLTVTYFLFFGLFIMVPLSRKFIKNNTWWAFSGFYKLT